MKNLLVIIGRVVLWSGLGFGDWYKASLAYGKPEFLLIGVSTPDTLVDTFPTKNIAKLVVIETGGGIMVGSICGLGTLYLTYPREKGTSWGETFDIGPEMFSCAMSTFSYLLGSALGVYFTGKFLKQEGSFWASLAGTFAGGTIGALGASFIQEYRTESVTPTIVILGISIPLGASLCYNEIFKF